MERKRSLEGRHTIFSIRSDYKRLCKFILSFRPLTPYFGYKSKALKLKRSRRFSHIKTGRFS